MKRIKSVISAALCLACAASASAIAVQSTAASANSAPHYWQGSAGYGVIGTGENCPLEVENEILTFNLPQVPKGSYTEQEFIKYSSENYVRAQYTFKNPTEEDITAQLAFPFGLPPEYGYNRYEDTANSVFDRDNQNFGVEINGEKVESTVRHSYYSGAYSWLPFDFAKSVSKLTDDFRQDDFYSPDLPVYSYWFTINSAERSYFNAICNIEYDKSKIRLMSDSLIYRTESGETYAIVSGNDDILLYSIGGELDLNAIEWSFYGSLYSNKNNKVNANVTLTASGNNITYKEFALKNRLADSSISEVDYYNIVTDKLIAAPHNYVSSMNMLEVDTYSLMRWFVYDMTVPAGGTLINTVTAPVYPTIKSSTYEYTYLLSPAKNWSKFGKLEINIITPSYLVGLDGFTKTENGYTCTYEGLPTDFDELTFTLSEREIIYGINGIVYPEDVYVLHGFAYFMFGVGGAITLFLVSCMIWLGVSANKGKNKGESTDKKYVK